MRREIILAGFGGQGILKAGFILGKSAVVYEGLEATFIPSYGPEARGGACSAQVVISDKKIHYPYADNPEILVAMSQEAFTKFIDRVKEEGIVIIDQDLVKIENFEVLKGKKLYKIPATRIAEKIGNRIASNIVMLGYLCKVTKIVKKESLKKSVESEVPPHTLELNISAFEAGYNHE